MKRGLAFALFAACLLGLHSVVEAASIAPPQPRRFGSTKEFLSWVREHRELKAAYGEGIFGLDPVPIDHFCVLKNPPIKPMQIQYWPGESRVLVIYSFSPPGNYEKNNPKSDITLACRESALGLGMQDKAAFASREGGFAIYEPYME
ncbi:MAG: hypothetical protein LBD02_10925 [Christensenellaceae bacterium]|jgi:hypothetical protein|nr:hypothetical protein [Christensenellaceae bacterium]